MPARIDLLEDGYVIRYDISDPWTMEEMFACYDQAKPLYDAANHKIHMLVNLEASRNLPHGVLRVRQDPGLSHPNGGTVALVGAATFVRAIAETILRLARNNQAKFFDKEELAWVFLRENIKKEQKRDS